MNQVRYYLVMSNCNISVICATINSTYFTLYWMKLQSLPIYHEPWPPAEWKTILLYQCLEEAHMAGHWTLVMAIRHFLSTFFDKLWCKDERSCWSNEHDSQMLGGTFNQHTVLKSQNYASTNLSLGSFLMKQGELHHYLSCKLPIDKWKLVYSLVGKTEPVQLL